MNDGCYDELDRRLRKRYPNDDEVVQETLHRVFKKISGGVKIKGEIEEYALGIARNVWRELRRSRKFVELTDSEALDLDEEPPPIDRERLNAILMRVLSKKERDLFRSYYLSGVIDVSGHRRRLAEKLGVKPNTLCKQANRLLEKIRRSL